MTKIIAVVAVFCSIIATVWFMFWFLWNEIAAGVFGAPELSFWQSVGLLILIGFISNGFRATVRSKN